MKIFKKVKNKNKLEIQLDAGESLSTSDFKLLSICLSLGLDVKYGEKLVTSVTNNKLFLINCGVCASRRINKKEISVTDNLNLQKMLEAGSKIQLSNGYIISGNLRFREVIIHSKNNTIISNHSMNESYITNIIEFILKNS
ncbi:hypothetical protein [Photobacterium kishitanii]|uniref:Uncharacterized protein n=1 Tax=Photobacterium kishitanii TaxID=318456 RepID=A0A2T3KLV9_9GAMM|nr:hypothetical protein [Photobacterium kishitanii]PSV00637.1 hypothetical protein C9J27_05730 [Photobacterium kishitanii]